MSELNDKCLETFPTWLRSLNEDVEAVLAGAGAEGIDEDAKRRLIGGINYLFKSLDLIPDGIDDIGYLDDAFVLRVASSLSEKALASANDDLVAPLKAMSEDCGLIKEFLGEDIYGRLQAYVEHLVDSSARGRTVDEIVGKEEVWNELRSEVKAFSSGYEAPSFTREPRNLIKLRAFFDAKLPK